MAIDIFLLEPGQAQSAARERVHAIEEGDVPALALLLAVYRRRTGLVAFDEYGDVLHRYTALGPLADAIREAQDGASDAERRALAPLAGLVRTARERGADLLLAGD